ncbi:MAG TPA: YqgE/AlgH family protein [Acidimicrobiales bacterium]|nr:YqgE/AlgH family protein [Acidimicrobiales bacterium]
MASPRLTDPNFWRTVVLLLDMNDEGAMGIVLNRPSETSVSDPLPGWEQMIAAPDVVFVGGPVQPDVAIALACSKFESDNSDPEIFREVTDCVGTLSLGIGPTDASARFESIRVFAGYSGWSPGQLEGELDAGAWFIVTAALEDMLSSDPQEVWRRVLKRQGGKLGMLANYPPNPSFN